MNTVDFLNKYVACKSISSDESKLSGMADARAILCDFFKSIDFSVDDLPTSGHNVIVARNKHNSAYKTVMFYGHYDVQPVEPIDLWTNDPFTLTEKNGRLFGRGASDNKGAHTVILAALKNLHDKKIDLNLNIIFLLEGEEEIGSRNMSSFLKKHKDSLKTDIIISTDTVSHDEQNIVITTGLRGLVTLDVSVTCNDRDLHSGYGGPIANPIQVLCEMCSKLHDNNGRVTIPGFYDNVDEPLEIERDSIKKLGLDDEQLKHSLGAHLLQVPDNNFSAQETFRFLPSLEFNGITGGHQGHGVKTIIPSCASVKISCRLVPNQKSEDIKEKLKKHLQTLCPEGVDLKIEFDSAGEPYKFLPKYLINKSANDFTSKCFASAENNIANIFGNKPAYTRDGGSIGVIQSFKDILDADSLLIGMILPEDTIHAPNESFSMKMLENGTKFFEKFIVDLINL